jgi:hypothetical protein
VAGSLLALLLAGSVQAQIYDSTQTFDTIGEGLTTGKFVLYPSIGYEYIYDSNILFMSTDLPGIEPIASGEIVLRGKLLASLPMTDSRIRWMYSPFTRNYTNDQFRPEDRLNHLFRMEGVFNQSGPLTTIVRDDFMRGTISLQETAIRNGLPVGLGHYSTHSPGLEFDLAVGPRHGFSLMPGYSRSNFNGLISTLGKIVDYGYTSRRLEGRYNYKLGEPTTLYLYGAGEEATQTVTATPDLDIQSRSAGVGLTRNIHEGVMTNVSAGYQTLTFEGGKGRDYNGPVAEGSVAWQIADLTRLVIEVLRKPYASIYTDSNYYMATEGKVTWTRQLGRDSFMDAGAALLEHEYVPDVGLGRKEEIIRLAVGAGHQFQKNLRAYIGLNYDQRESNVVLSGPDGADPFQYRLHRIIFKIEAGWL